MKPPNQHQRINLGEMKSLIVKKLGPEGSKKYFYCLSRFLSLKLSKVEFNKLCIRIFGRDNIPLHNQFIHSILKNSCSAKVPPPTHDKEVLKSVRAAGNKEPPSDGHKQSVPNLSGLSNGGILLLSPRKARTRTRDRKVLDRTNGPGPNGKTNFVSHHLSTEQDSKSKGFLQNGDLTLHGIQKPVQHHEGPISPSLSLTKKLPNGSVSVHTKDQIETVPNENRKEVSARSVLCAPLGVPSCPVSVGGACKITPLASSSNFAISSFDSGGLLDTATLRERMEQIAATQGLEGVPMDCANLLNNGLDAYLKGLILSCIELVRARSGHEPTKSSTTHNHQAQLKLVNGVRPTHQNFQSQMEDIREMRPHYTVSLSDFRVAMELNPQQLGEDWPLLLEKICTHSFDE